jgi:hypothetical protein
VIIGDHSRCRLRRFELGVYFLQPRSECFDLLLLFGDCRSLLLYCLVLFKELI